MKLKTLFIVFLAAFVSGCGLFGKKGGKASRTTGWEYNAEETGNIPNISGYKQETGPGLVFIQGGTFTMGRVEQDVMYNWDNHPRRVTVASFYMDETEVSNLDYREYTHWVERVYPGDTAKMNSILPDTTTWRSELAYMNHMCEIISDIQPIAIIRLSVLVGNRQKPIVHGARTG